MVQGCKRNGKAVFNCCTSPNFIHYHLMKLRAILEEWNYELTRLLSVARRSMSAVSIISTMNVLRSRDRSSLAPILENNLSTTLSWAKSAGTKEPTCAKMAIKAVWRRKVDFPAIFGPVIMCKLDVGLISIEFGINWRPEERRPISTGGCLPFTTE